MPAEAKAYARAADRPLVVKADGLAAGKGVLLCKNAAEAEDRRWHSVMVEQGLRPGRATPCVVEEFLTRRGGLLPGLQRRQDHRAHALLPGPQGGGRGRHRPQHRRHGGLFPGPGGHSAEIALEKAMDQVIQAHDPGHGQRGASLQGHPLRRADDRPRTGELGVLEFNVRFGDPEAQPLLVRLESRPGRHSLEAGPGQAGRGRGEVVGLAAQRVRGAWPRAATPASTRPASRSPAWRTRPPAARSPCSTRAPNWWTANWSPPGAGCWGSPPWATAWPRPSSGPTRPAT